MQHAVITNIPKNPKEILDEALRVSFHSWVDEKGTKDNPGVWFRRPSKLSYEEAFEIIQNSKPHWIFSFRNMKYITDYQEDYWEFGGCNIGGSTYGEVFIWIQVSMDKSLELIEKFNLKIKSY